jgi:hypothetical protein
VVAPGPTFGTGHGRRRVERRRRRIAWAIRIAAIVAAFGIGIAVGEALHDNPRPGGTQTLIRTLRPVP